MAPGRYRIIGSTVEAVAFLLKDWPQSEEGKPLWAQRICLEVFAGLRPDEDARGAFLVACGSAGILTTNSDAGNDHGRQNLDNASGV